MEHPKTIEVALPAGLQIGPDDVEILQATLQTIVSLMRQSAGLPCEPLRDMLDRGWEVHCGVTWLVSGRRDKDYEEATGPTREVALDRLRQAACLHESDGCP